MDTALAFASALELGHLVRRRELSPVELVEFFLQRIEHLNPKCNAFITITADRALAAAKNQADLQLREPLPPFFGVPIAIKDLEDTAGVLTTLGSGACRDRVPKTDSRVVRLLKQAGFILIGKTNTPEFGLGPFTDPLAFGACRNPWDLSRTSGGSSGGAAAAVAAGMCPLAQASDSGGSIRTPAAACGIVGLKPSRGRVSAAPEPVDFFGQNGAVTRTIADTAAILDLLCQPEMGDAWYLPAPETAFLTEVGRPPGHLRIAFTSDPPYPSVKVADANRLAVTETAAWLSALGHDLEEKAPAWPGEQLHELFMSAAIERFLADKALPDEAALEPLTRKSIDLARSATLEDYLRLNRARQLIGRQLAQIFEVYDVLVTPTLAVAPPAVGALQAAITAADPARALQDLISFYPPPFTRPWNISGQPAITLPLHTDPNGLPIGIQLIGRPGGEAILLRLGAQLEQAYPWRQRRPAIC